MKHKKIFVFLSMLFSILTSLIVINYIISRFYKPTKPGFISQLVNDSIFDIRYVFWKKPYCNNFICSNSLEKVATSKIDIFNEDYGNCENIVFLGDSFTDSPWDGKGKSYSWYFVSNLASKQNKCYRLIRLAASGSGTDQQMAKFSDNIKILHPKLVVWQFYWNDFYDNLEKPIYFINNGKLERKISYSSAYFWTGWINQNIPFINGTSLGDFLLNFGELKEDLHSNWFDIEQEEALFFQFNQEKIFVLLREMQSLGKKYNFDLVTTLSPLECEFIYNGICNELDEYDPIPYSFFEKVQNELETILSNNSNYISMFNGQFFCKANELVPWDFWEHEFKLGARHLSNSGQKKVGEIFFLNFSFMKKYVDKNI